MVEADLIMARCPDYPLNADLTRQKNQVSSIAAPVFNLIIPDDLLSRAVALRTLRRFIEHRNPHRRGYRVNYNRYLGPFKWPQSSFYPAMHSLIYSRRQLEAYMVSRWPIGHENEEEARAISWALRYPNNVSDLEALRQLASIR
jgi:hypothetical protein